jgi:hypothetical protein
VAAVTASGADAATLTAARATIEILADGDCDVRMQFTVNAESPATSDHLLLLSDPGSVDRVTVTGVPRGEARAAGRALHVPVSLAAGRNEYEARYRVAQEPGHVRCALLVPDVPTDGLGRVVHVETILPSGATRLSGDFPALAWRENRGTVDLGHLPAFTTVAYRDRSRQAASWLESLDVRTTMDLAAVVVFVSATIIWSMVRRKVR